MLSAAGKALTQMFSPPFRTVLLKSVGLAVAFLAVVMIALYRISYWLTGAGETWLELQVGPILHGPLYVLGWLLAVAIGLGLLAGAVLLMPAVTSLTAGFFCDEVAEQVERRYYPLDLPGRAVPLPRAVLEGIKTALLSVAVYLCAAPFLLLAGAGVVIFFLATAYLLGREYFELAAMRFHPVVQAKVLRRANGTTVFIAGMFIAVFVSIPILNLATPLFGVAFMVHVHKRLVGGAKREMFQPLR